MSISFKNRAYKYHPTVTPTKKVVSAIPVRLKCETRYSRYSHALRNILTAAAMSKILG